MPTASACGLAYIVRFSHCFKETKRNDRISDEVLNAGSSRPREQIK